MATSGKAIAVADSKSFFLNLDRNPAPRSPGPIFVKRMMFIARFAVVSIGKTQELSTRASTPRL